MNSFTSSHFDLSPLMLYVDSHRVSEERAPADFFLRFDTLGDCLGFSCLDASLELGSLELGGLGVILVSLIVGADVFFVPFEVLRIVPEFSFVIFA